jgi:hypothetical protein
MQMRDICIHNDKPMKKNLIAFKIYSFGVTIFSPRKIFILTSRGVAVEYAGYDAAMKLEWNKMFQQQQVPAVSVFNSFELFPSHFSYLNFIFAFINFIFQVNLMI